MRDMTYDEVLAAARQLTPGEKLQLVAALNAELESKVGTMAQWAEITDKYSVDLGSTDTAERSREILNTEFPEYLKRRMSSDEV
jgi:hypothetical protein